MIGEGSHVLRNVRHLLDTAAYLPEELIRVLDAPKPFILLFDPELGYVPADYSLRDGFDNTRTASTYDPVHHHRTLINHADQPCRVNTYGNSFTQCAQVNDSQTWQEYLAGQFREPIRNFGVGGYGVYQAYLRAMRIEPTDMGAQYVILNIWEDDHLRSLDAARWIRIAWMRRDLPRGGGPDMYPAQGFPWSHLRYDLDEQGFVERPGCCQSESDLRRLSDPDHFHEVFKDDQVVHLYTLREGGDAPIGQLEQVAEAFGLNVDLRDQKRRGTDALRLHLTYGLRSTRHVLDRFRQWAHHNGRELMVLLSYDPVTAKQFIQTQQRFDQELVDYLDADNIPHVDSLVESAREYKLFNIDIDDFLERFYIGRAGAQVFGHYSPQGNFWFALAIRQRILDWLNPKPPAYR